MRGLGCGDGDGWCGAYTVMCVIVRNTHKTFQKQQGLRESTFTQEKSKQLPDYYSSCGLRVS